MPAGLQPDPNTGQIASVAKIGWERGGLFLNGATIELRNKDGSVASGGGGASLPIAQSDVTGLPAALAGKVSRSQPRGLLRAPIADSRWGGYHQGFVTPGVTDRTFQYLVTPDHDVLGAVLGFGNWIVGNSTPGTGEAVNTNPITVSFSFNPIQTTNSFNVGTFGGAQTVTLQPGATVFSDPFPWGLRAAATYLFRVVVTLASSAHFYPSGITTIAASAIGGNGEGSANSNSLTANAIAGSTIAGYHPFVMLDGSPLAAPTKAGVFCVGDSILAANTGDTIDQGYVRRGLDTAGVPWVRMASGGLNASSFLAAAGTSSAYDFHVALNAESGLPYALCEFGSNDIANNLWTTLGQAQTALTALWAALGACGARVYQTTILPRNAFSGAQEALRVSVNDWIRTVPTGLYGIVEAADLAETARNSGVQRVGYFTDGTHPNATGAPAISACLNAGQFPLY